MARKQGGVNKFLNFIGLVDAEPQTAVDDYADNYGRPSTYVPKQQRSRTEDTRRRTIVKDERGRYGADRYASTRVTPPASRRSSSSGYDYNYVPRDTRSSYEPASTRAQTRAQRQRTLMCSLNTLEDCCDVIDSLIAGNVVVLTLDEIGQFFQNFWFRFVFLFVVLIIVFSIVVNAVKRKKRKRYRRVTRRRHF